MSGTKKGAAKAAKTNKEKYGKDFYAKIGGRSWKNPNRSHETGFALLPPEERARLGAEGGKKNKGKKYAKKFKEENILTAEEFAAIAKLDKDGPGVSE